MVLHQLERERLTQELEELARHIHQEDFDVAIIVDKSARPLAIPIKKIMREAFGKELKIYFINPIRLKYELIGIKLIGIMAARITQEHIQTLKKEFPRLESDIKGKKVIVIDDQERSGGTLLAVRKLIEKAGARVVKARALSIWFKHGDAYSWRVNALSRVTNPGKGRFFQSEPRELDAEKKAAFERFHRKMNKTVIPNVVKSLKPR